jgi:hypothetical protein
LTFSNAPSNNLKIPIARVPSLAFNLVLLTATSQIRSLAHHQVIFCSKFGAPFGDLPNQVVYTPSSGFPLKMLLQ